MKKIILLFILVPISALAEFYPGTIKFNNESTKIGLIELGDGKENKIKYKSDNNSKIEKFKAEDVKEFQIINKKNETEFYTTIILGNNRLFSPKEFNLDKGKSFVRVVKQGKINLYLVHFKGSSSQGNTISTFGADAYYLQRENDKFAFAIGIHRYDLDFMSGFDVYLVVRYNFEKICPEFEELLRKEKLNATEFYKIVDIYEQNCSKK